MGGGVVIIGAGQAGLQAAISLREGGYGGSVTILGDESHPPYQRPPLSKSFLLGGMDADSLRLRPPALIDRLGIDLRLGTRANAIDRRSRAVVDANGISVPYEHAIIATGSRPRLVSVSGSDRARIATLRTVSDGHDLRDRLSTAKNIVVIGAGFIGLEFAAIARKLGCNVHVVESARRIMSRVVSATTAEYVHNRHVQAGVRFSLGCMVSAVESREDGAVDIHLSDGRLLKTDLVLAGTGAVPNCEIAREAGLAVEDGILVDEHLLTSDPHISAIGDCARHPSAFSGSCIRIESVQNAMDQARTVAARLLGKAAAYDAVPWFWSDQGNLKIQIAGIVSGHDHSVLRGSMVEGAFSNFCFRGGHFVGVESVNKPGDNMLARRLLTTSRTLRLSDFEDCHFNMKALLGKVADGCAVA